MIKISWGTRIAILYIGFAALMIVMVILSVNQKIDLVSDDYYERELHFENRLNQLKNADSLNEKINYRITDRAVEIIFPNVFKGKNVSGAIFFFRPSDASKDYKTSIQLDGEGAQRVGLNMLTRGMYKMQTSWHVDNVDYFSEETIVIP